jgi:hypothetical protein
MKTIPIVIKGFDETLQAMVNDEDYEESIRYKWRLSKGGYPITGDTYLLSLHRLVAIRFLDVSKISKGVRVIDHINGNKLDNQRNNLRIIANKENSQNRKMHKNNTTGFRGVVRRRDRGKFVSTIRIGNFIRTIGYFDTAEEAAIEYDRYAKTFFGETFDKFNFPDKVGEIIPVTALEFLGE